MDQMEGREQADLAALVAPVDMQGGFVTTPIAPEPVSLDRAPKWRHLQKWVLLFWQEASRQGMRFINIRQLQRFIREQTGYLPDRPQRVLLKMKRDGHINYRWENRRNGLIEILPPGASTGENTDAE